MSNLGRRYTIALLAILCLVLPNSGRAQEPTIEALAPAQGFAVGTDSITVIGVVKNSGTVPVPPDMFRGRFFALSGLDYVSGDTAPLIPALAPGGSVVYKWRLRPLSDSGS